MRDKLLSAVIIIALFFSFNAMAQEEPPPLDYDQTLPELPVDQDQPAQEPYPPYEAMEPAASFSPAGGPPQVGEISVNKNKISLDIKGMDIIDVLKMLSQRAGMNMAIGRNVTGRVTLFLKDVDVWDAFEIILLANDLAYDRKGGIINIMTQRDYELLYGERYQDKKQAKVFQLKYAKAADLSKALNQIKTNLGRVIVDEGSNTLVLVDTPPKIKEMEDFINRTDMLLETKIFSLNYAQAEKVSVKLQEALTKGVGSMRIDERTNKIAITDYPEKLKELGNIIRAFDEKTPQVLIDAQILEIKPSDKLNMGVDWDFFIKKNLRVASSLPTSGAVNTLKVGVATDSRTPTSKEDYKAIIDLLRTIGDTKILSSPRIMALNNQEAKILVGTKDAYITSTTSQGGSGSTVTSQSVNFVDVGIKLFVTPTINRDGFVTMKIKPEISSSTRTNITSEGQVTQIPIVTTSEAETTVMIKDGVTIIIGGLQKDEKTKTLTRVPVLGDIPVLGWFFGNISHEIKKTEIVILLTPHIVSGETSYADFSAIPPKDGSVAKMVKGEIIKERMLPIAGPASTTPSSEYYNFVVKKVQEVAMIDRPKGEKGEVQVEFTLTKKGRLSGEPQILSIDNPVLQPFVVRAIKNASPFPPFPASLVKEKQAFKISLDYE
jgi:MSHA type pilus biogenesis protein MshL